MRLVRAVSAGTGCSIASGRSASSSSSRRPYAASTFPASRAAACAARRVARGSMVQIASKRRSRSSGPCGLDRARLLPGQQARRVAGGVDDHGPLVRERLALGDRHLHRSARRPPQRREVGEDGGRVGVARHPPPARLERAIEALALEGAEEHRRGRAGEQLVLDRARQRHQRRLAQHLRPGAVVGGRHRGEDRRMVRRRRGLPRALERGAHRKPTPAVGARAAQRLHVLGLVSPVARGGATRARKAVALLPHADRAGRQPGLLGDLANAQPICHRPSHRDRYGRRTRRGSSPAPREP